MDYAAAGKSFREQGFAVIPGFLSDQEVEELRQETKKVVDGLQLGSDGSTFNSETNTLSGEYYLNSVDKIRYFYEKGAFDENGKLVLPKDVCLSKLAHGLHVENETYRKVIFSEKAQGVLKAIGYRKPTVIQSMINFKNPGGHGSEYIPHQDATYLYTSPEVQVVGFWIPLEDATIENGCLWFIPNSHEYPLATRYVRVKKGDEVGLELTAPPKQYEESLFVAAPVKKGDLVLIHGLVVHKSERNHSKNPRPAYAWHIYDQQDESKWAEDNWCQPPANQQFHVVYEEIEA